jgi:hypothetical protein
MYYNCLFYNFIYFKFLLIDAVWQKPLARPRREPTMRSIHREVQRELDEIDLLADELARTPLLSPRQTARRSFSSTPVTPYLRHLATCRALPFMTSSEVRIVARPETRASRP